MLISSLTMLEKARPLSDAIQLNFLIIQLNTSKRKQTSHRFNLGIITLVCS